MDELEELGILEDDDEESDRGDRDNSMLTVEETFPLSLVKQ
jgi:hypothetical protein